MTAAASAALRLPVAILWHMHQPQYRDALSGEYVLPWTYLHALKDYSDMAAHLEEVPGAKAIVNFTPVLIEQLDEYAERVARHLRSAEPLGDPLLATLGSEPLPIDGEARLALLRALLRAHRVHLIERNPPFLDLVRLAESLASPERAAYISDALLHDLSVWYHIAWTGESIRRSDLRIAALMSAERGYTAAQRRTLLELIGEVLAGILPRYRALGASGRVELSVTPYGHPIIPLMFDLHSARDSQPAAELPKHRVYDGGADRAAWHVAESMRVFQEHFGERPRGCWPAEGAVSTETLALLDGFGFEWAATSANVLRASLGDAADDPRSYERGWRVGAQGMRNFFRHDHLSDAIGFEYARWHGDHAAEHFAGEVGALADRLRAEAPQDFGNRVLLIALDGENAWEHYPFNGYYFLRGMYAALAADPRLELVTLAEICAREPETGVLPAMKAGSWVHGTLSTWIGDPVKNAAWDLLCEAKQVFDRVVVEGALDESAVAAAERQLALCESSDWFWWFGDYNPAEAVRQFDELYRRQLTNLYRLLKIEAPSALSVPLQHGVMSSGAAELGGAMRRSNAG